MTDLEHILPLWSELEASGADYVLATVVAVEGSSYRKPGARMLMAQDGRRAGTVSGGCLEAEVVRRATWPRFSIWSWIPRKINTRRKSRPPPALNRRLRRLRTR